ncbi:MAG: alpha/beta hydrolase [Lentilitoribacter sp.]
MSSMPVLKHYVTLGDATPWQIHYRSQGERELPTVILLHASPMSSAMMVPMMNALSDSFHVIAIDTPGYGQSDPLPQSDNDSEQQPNTSLQPYVAALHAFIEKLEIHKPIIYGSATGAQIAIEFAKVYPTVIKGIVLENAAWFKDQERDAIVKHYFPDIKPKKDGSHLTLVWKMASQLFHYFPWFDTTEQARVSQAEIPPEAVHDTLMAYFNAGENYHLAYRAAFMNERPEQLRPVTVPTYIIRWSSSVLKQYVDRLDDANLPENIQMCVAQNGIEGRFAAIKASMRSLRQTGSE